MQVIDTCILNAHNARVVSRPISLLLAICLCLIGTGVMEHLHTLDHNRQDAAVQRLAHDHGEHSPAQPVHTDDNCAIHRQLHSPIASFHTVPVLVTLGLLVPFLTMLATPLVSQRPLERISCRGPPAC